MHKDKLVNILNKILEWSLYILVFTIPFSKTIIEICITVAFFAWISQKILTADFKLRKTPLNLFLFLFFIANLLSFINADFKLLFARSIISKCLKFIILYFIIVETIDSITKLRNLLKMALISAVAVMADCYLQKFLLHVDVFRLYPSFKYAPLTDPSGHTGFPTGPFPFPNDLAAWMLIILMPALCLFVWGLKNKYVKLSLGTFIFPFLLLFYLTNVRSAWLSFLVSFFVISFLQSKKFFLAFLAIAMTAGIILFIFVPKENMGNITGFSSTQDRFYMWRIGWKIFSEHPIIGNGLNSFFNEFKEEREDEYKNKSGSYAHNGFLQMAAEIGVAGLTAFLLLIGTTFKSAFYYVKKSTDIFNKMLCLGLACGILAFLMHSFFDTNLQSLPLVTFLWVTLGLLMALQGLHAEEI